MEVIEDVRVLELVDLVEYDDVRRAAVVVEPVEKFVPGRRLAVDVEGLIEPFENAVERLVG